MNVEQALQELRKVEKRKFQQGIDLIINLKGVDPKKDAIASIVTLPHKLKEKKVCAFLAAKTSAVKTITPPEFQKYKDAKELKKLVKEYDFFIAEAKLMPQVATIFGKVLGPTGKMPSPQLGVLMQVTESSIQELLTKISTALKIRVKEPSVKVSIGNEGMSDQELTANIQAVYQSLVQALPVKRDNVKSVLLKLTMSKPVKVEIK